VTGPLPERVLPIRVPVVPGESLDSWLEALARRNSVSIRRLVAALGWRVPNTPGGLVAGVPGGVLRRIERQAGLRPGLLDDAVLDRYLPLGPVRRSGSRFCPRCLAESGGRWLLAWRLPWVFACTRHQALLQDTCPGCGRAPREYAGVAGLNPPGTCVNSITRGRCCGTDLAAVAPQPVTPDDRALRAQQWTGGLLTATAHAGDQATSPTQVLTDLDVVAGWLLRQSPGRSSRPEPGTRGTSRAQPPAARDQPGRLPPASAALTATLAARAMTLLAGEDGDAITAIRPLLRHQPGRGPVRPAGLTPQQWKRLSGPARGRFLRALDPGMTAADRLRHRSGTHPS
jgi:hypothetical protein